MRISKILKPKLSLFTVLIAFLLLNSSCQERNRSDSVSTALDLSHNRYGGVFKMNEVESFRSLAPHSITDITSNNIASQIYEGLLRLNPKTLEITPGLAESWDVSADGLIYTFNLRKGVFFHENICFIGAATREVNADDVIYSFTQLFTPSDENQLHSLLTERVLGAHEYYQNKLKGINTVNSIAGLKKLDDYSVRIVLLEPFSGFLELITTPVGWIYPKEADDYYGSILRENAVGTGPFRLHKLIENQVLILSKNPKYWRKDSLGQTLPYLDAIKYTFVKSKKEEMAAFFDGHLDLVFELGSTYVKKLKLDINKDFGTFETDSFIVQISPAMSVQFYGFKHSGNIFNNHNVRQAFNCAINRNLIVDEVLYGLGVPANLGFVPPYFADYNVDSLNNYSYNPDRAKKYLADAGYPNGQGFPRLTLNINSGGGMSNLKVAEAVAKMLSDNLNITIDLSVTDRNQHYDWVESGLTEFWKDAWMADFYDPGSFLCLFYGKFVPEDSTEKAYLNSMRYINQSFDKIYREAMREANRSKRMALYHKAEHIILSDAVVIPLYYDKTIRLLSKRVRNFPINTMEVRDFGTVYFSTDLTGFNDY